MVRLNRRLPNYIMKQNTLTSHIYLHFAKASGEDHKLIAVPPQSDDMRPIGTE